MLYMHKLNAYNSRYDAVGGMLWARKAKSNGRTTPLILGGAVCVFHQHANIAMLKLGPNVSE